MRQKELLSCVPSHNLSTVTSNEEFIMYCLIEEIDSQKNKEVMMMMIIIIFPFDDVSVCLQRCPSLILKHHGRSHTEKLVLSWDKLCEEEEKR